MQPLQPLQPAQAAKWVLAGAAYAAETIAPTETEDNKAATTNDDFFIINFP